MVIYRRWAPFVVLFLPTELAFRLYCALCGGTGANTCNGTRPQRCRLLAQTAVVRKRTTNGALDGVERGVGLELRVLRKNLMDRIFKGWRVDGDVYDGEIIKECFGEVFYVFFFDGIAYL